MRCKQLIGLLVVLVGLGTGSSWVMRYNGPANDEDRAAAIAANDASGVYVTGTSWGGSSFDVLTIKYSLAGESLWAMRYDGTQQGADEGRAIAVARGRVAVAGSVTASNFMTDALLLVHDATNGTPIWSACYDGPAAGNEDGLAIAFDSSGAVIAAGYQSGAGTEWDWCVLKYGSDGVRRWVSSYVTPEFDYVVAVAVDANGDVYAAGNSGSPYTLRWDMVTAKFDGRTGETLWVRRLNGQADDDDEVKAMVLDRFGNVYVAGGTTGLTSSVDLTVIKYGPTGESLWAVTYNGPANGVDWANAIAVDYWGNVYVAGYSQDTQNDFDFVTLKFNTGGGQEWIARYDGPGHGFDEARAITVDNYGRWVAVVGTSTGDGTRNDYATVVYDSLGNQCWVYRYDGPASRIDEPVAMVADADHGICVTGTSDGGGTGSDYATARYPALGISERDTGRRARAAVLTVTPNPCREQAELRLELSAPTCIQPVIWDGLGRVRARLQPVTAAAGCQRIELRPAQLGLEPGVYFAGARLGADEQRVRFVVARAGE